MQLGLMDSVRNACLSEACGLNVFTAFAKGKKWRHSRFSVSIVAFF